MNAADEFLVHYGKNAALGSFTAPPELAPFRGARVVVEGPRGREVGTILAPSSSQGLPRTGTILRLLGAEDEDALTHLLLQGEEVFTTAAAVANSLAGLSVLDVDMPLQGAPILQVLADPAADLASFAQSLETLLGQPILIENLAEPLPIETDHSHEGGCGKPDCGRDSGGGCTTCGTGGGCSSCGSGGTDLADYFAHLRTKMETTRVPLA